MLPRAGLGMEAVAVAGGLVSLAFAAGVLRRRLARPRRPRPRD